MTRNVLRNSRAAVVSASLLSLAVVVVGCAAPYDQASDDAVTAIQKKLDAHFVATTKPGAASQPVDVAFFDSVRADLRLLAFRTGARGSDPSLKKQAALLDDIRLQLDDVQWLENDHLAQPDLWEGARDGVETGVKGFLAAELTRKDDK